jgi:hypothetical protein
VPSAAHEIVIQVIAEQPELLGLLAECLLGRAVDLQVKAVDSTVRFVETEEARPDLYLEGSGGWVALEVQSRIDEAKATRWPVMMAVKAHQAGRMGDLVVLTTSRAVARWAEKIGERYGPLGTSMTLRPIVLLVADEAIVRLAAADGPGLKFFAAWAMRGRRKPEALEVVRAVVEPNAGVPEPLRALLRSAIINLYGERTLANLEEKRMKLSDLTLTPRQHAILNPPERVRQLEQFFYGKADAILKVIEARGIHLTFKQHWTIRGCIDFDEMDGYLERALTATTAADIFRSSRRKSAAKVKRVAKKKK